MTPHRKITVKRQITHTGIALALGVVPWSKLGNLVNDSYSFNSTTAILLPILSAIVGGFLWWYILEQGTIKSIAERLQSF